jgi:hypothetical protein
MSADWVRFSFYSIAFVGLCYFAVFNVPDMRFVRKRPGYLAMLGVFSLTVISVFFLLFYFKLFTLPRSSPPYVFGYTFMLPLTMIALRGFTALMKKRKKKGGMTRTRKREQGRTGGRP